VVVALELDVEVPSPNVHAYDTIEPSESDEVDALNEHDKPVHDEVKAAVGG
jgi:hypothetical protein